MKVSAPLLSVDVTAAFRASLSDRNRSSRKWLVSFAIHHFQRPGRVRREAVDLDSEWQAVNDCPLALAGMDHVGRLVDHRAVVAV